MPLEQNDITALVTQAVEALGLTLYGCQFIPKSAMLRIFIDKQGGVTLEDCTQATRQIQAVCEVENVSLDDFHLEVSSPGVSRPLFTLPHFEAAVGEKVFVKLHAPLPSGQKKFEGVLKGLSDTVFTVQDEAELFQFDFDNVQKAHVVGEVTFK